MPVASQENRARRIVLNAPAVLILSLCRNIGRRRHSAVKLLPLLLIGQPIPLLCTNLAAKTYCVAIELPRELHIGAVDRFATDGTTDINGRGRLGRCTTSSSGTAAGLLHRCNAFWSRVARATRERTFATATTHGGYCNDRSQESDNCRKSLPQIVHFISPVSCCNSLRRSFFWFKKVVAS